MGVFEKLKRFMGLEKNESAFEEEHEAEDKLQRADPRKKSMIIFCSSVVKADKCPLAVNS